jgi:hypothetical protein
MARLTLLPSSALRQLAALLSVAALIVPPASAFDSYWHAQCVQRAGKQYGFTQSAWKIMQLGTSRRIFSAVLRQNSIRTSR